jgi:hypothetical protein
MTIRRRRLWLVALAGLAALAIWLSATFGKPMYVTQAQAAKVKNDMTLTEVKAILGYEDDTEILGVTRCSLWRTWTGDLRVWTRNNKVILVKNSEYPDQWEMWTNRIRRTPGW